MVYSAKVWSNTRQFMLKPETVCSAPRMTHHFLSETAIFMTFSFGQPENRKYEKSFSKLKMKKLNGKAIIHFLYKEKIKKLFKIIFAHQNKIMQ